MRFDLYKDVKSFYQDTYDVLMRHEAQNMILLGNIIIGNAGTDKSGWRNPANWLMTTVSDNTGVKLTALMTPPHNLTLHATDNLIDDKALDCLVNGIANSGFVISGIMADKPLAERFAQIYAGTKFSIHKNQRIYELLKVNPEIPPVPLRLAQESDMAFLPYWLEGFNNDCFNKPLSVQREPESYLYEIGRKRLYVLEDNSTPVSIAKIGREIQSVCGIGHVYTPPYFRNKGYATTCVAAISRLALERGFTKCVLYTDLANPVSNSIYQKIGYTPIRDSLEIKFNYEK